ncbi:hypothetical protein IFM89_034826 [Coptis chinensis]|uniref:Uncharacterized protein n=1 Tax=Coptis chinensis TaxID=261450 RepID=A0A835HAZ2_9MAGN|nr:hypothetical protein IFM89_034826 [Coptis chinensis]
MNTEYLHPTAKVSVAPSATALVIKALKEPERDWKMTKDIKHTRNISIDDLTEIAKIMKPRRILVMVFCMVIIGRCVICGGVGISDAYYCKECTQQEKDKDGCPKIVDLGSAKTDLFYERKKYGFKKR